MVSGCSGQDGALLRPSWLHGLEEETKQPVNIRQAIRNSIRALGKISTWKSQIDLLAGVNPYRSTPSQNSQNQKREKPPKEHYSYLHG